MLYSLMMATSVIGVVSAGWMVVDNWARTSRLQVTSNCDFDNVTRPCNACLAADRCGHRAETV